MDQKLFLLLNRVWVNPVLDWFMAVLSSFDAWLPLLILAALAFAWRGGFRPRAFLLVAALTLALSDGVVAHTLKRLTDRPRPADAAAGVRQVDLAKATPRFKALFRPVKVRFSPVPKGPVPGRSFPSAHTVNITALAILALLIFPRRGWLMLPLAFGVAYSRIYTGSHWPSDVTASLFLGAALGLLGYLTAELAWRRYGARLLPRCASAHPVLAGSA